MKIILVFASIVLASYSFPTHSRASKALILMLEEDFKHDVLQKVEIKSRSKRNDDDDDCSCSEEDYDDCSCSKEKDDDDDDCSCSKEDDDDCSCSEEDDSGEKKKDKDSGEKKKDKDSGERNKDKDSGEKKRDKDSGVKNKDKNSGESTRTKHVDKTPMVEFGEFSQREEIEENLNTVETVVNVTININDEIFEEDSNTDETNDNFIDIIDVRFDDTSNKNIDISTPDRTEENDDHKSVVDVIDLRSAALV